MPAEVAALEPSASVTAWSWVIEELADCKDIDASIIGAILKWNPSIIADPFYGDGARKRLALRCLEELESSLNQSRKDEGLNIPSGFLTKSHRSILRQEIQQRRDALPKSSLDSLTDTILKELDVINNSGIISKRLKSNTSETHFHEHLSSEENVLVREDSISEKPIDRDQNIFPDSPSDDEGSHDDEAPDPCPNETQFFAESLRFLSSQNPLSDGCQTEQKSCIKCDEAGDVLECTGSNCPITIHPSCLGSDYSFTNPEDFKCPFCSYLQALSEYNEARKKFSAAKKTLSGLLGRGKEERKRVKPSSLVRETKPSENPQNISEQLKASVQERVSQLKSIAVEPTPSNITKTDRIYPSSELRDQEQMESDLKDEDTSTTKTTNDTEQKESEVNAGAVPATAKCRKPRRAALKPKHYKNPVMPWARRNRLAWTEEEEAKLKEAMEKIYPDIESRNSDISWIRILEYGEKVFHRTRKPMDLKDKWRNINSRHG